MLKRNSLTVSQRAVLYRYVLPPLFLFFSTLAYSQQYDFPVRPGSEQWKSFASSEEMYAACQIPDGMLHAMSTSDLAKTCLDYPMISTLYAYNDLQKGFQNLTVKFNGFQELLKRPDAGIVILEIYRKMMPGAIQPSWNTVQKGKFALSFDFVEVLLAQRQIQSTLTPVKKKDLVDQCIKKYTEKKNNIEFFGTYGTSTSAWVAARTIKEKNPVRLNNQGRMSEKELAEYAFVEQGLVVDPDVVEGIMREAKTYAK